MMRFLALTVLGVGLAMFVGTAPVDAAGKKAIVKVTMAYPVTNGMFNSGDVPYGTYSGIGNPTVVLKVYDACSTLVGTYACTATPLVPGSGSGTWETNNQVVLPTEATYTFTVSITATIAAQSATNVLVP